LVLKVLGDVGAGHVLGRYELLMPIASGGMATVWAARLKGTRGFQKTVAIKTMLPSMSEDPQFEEMFISEATLASYVHHPNVVEILELGEENGVLFLVMEWVDGEPLSVLMKAAAKKGGIPLPIAIRIATQTCAGLHAAHELRNENGELLGLVHRDVSPQNVLVAYDGIVKVVDFGVAKATAVASSANTSAGQIKGKAAYMSPEQARGGTIDRRTDVFAVGILLYQLTTGRHPFRAENDVATLYNICSEAPVFPPRRIVPTIPAALEAVIQQALAKDLTRRYATANDLYRALDRVMTAERASDDEVRAFVHGLLGDRQEKRSEALRAALRLADDRAAGRAVLQSSAELTPGSGVSSIGLGSSGRLRAPGFESVPDRASTTGSAGTVMAGTVSQSGSISAQMQGKPVWRKLPILGGVIVGGAAIWGIMTVLRPAVTTPEPSPATAAIATPAPTPTAPPTPAESTSATSPSDLPIDIDEEADAGASVAKKPTAKTGHWTGKHTTTAKPEPTKPATSAPPAATKKPPTTFVPPVRDPGF
jgi:eukaryotic-like serine/threonine-protein kinase